MSARYGSRTRSGEAVSDLGRRGGGGGGGLTDVYEQTFTSPGTWPWPGNVSFVEVLVVGGGGGGCAPPGQTRGGSGGGLGEFQVPVSAPVPVVIGSGGAGGPFASGTPGGASSFGPTAIVYGGRGYNGPWPSPVGNVLWDAGGVIEGETKDSNRYGSFGLPTPNGGTFGGAGYNGEAKYGYGGGSNTNTNWQSAGGGAGNSASPGANFPNGTAGLANTGGGGGGGNPTGLPGGSGVVIVRWYE